MIANKKQISLLHMIWRKHYTDTTPTGCYHEADLAYFDERLRKEGLQFLTVELPKLGKALEQAFHDGKPFVCPAGFKRRKGSKLPQFLNRALSLLLTPSGVWRGEADGIPPFLQRALYSELSTVVQWVRQLSLMFYKMQLPFQPAQKQAIMASFRSTEKEIQYLPWSSIWMKRREDLILMRAVIGELFRFYKEADETPRHGSGAAADKRKPWQRYEPAQFIERLHKTYPYNEWFCLSDVTCDVNKTLYSMGVPVEPPAQVTFVPKDSRGPRLISKEPPEFMYIQQAIMRAMYLMMKRHWYGSRSLDCTDQTRNRDWAVRGSGPEQAATVDLAEASDRVSLELVRALFPSKITEKLEATRSLSTMCPLTGDEIPLSKFAPMGSALCFPVETIVFWAAAVVATHGESCLRVVKQRQEQPVVAVFGDDIVVPQEAYTRLSGLLEDIGLKVNADKSFSTGPFRESCGMDAFLGEDVSIVRFNHLPVVDPKKRQLYDYTKCRVSDYMNNVIKQHGTWMTPGLRRLFVSFLGDIPVLPTDAPSGCYLVGDTVDARLHRGPLYKASKPKACGIDYQRPQVRMLVEQPRRSHIDNSGWCHVLRSLLSQGGLEGTSVVLPQNQVTIRPKWVWI